MTSKHLLLLVLLTGAACSEAQSTFHLTKEWETVVAPSESKRFDVHVCVGENGSVHAIASDGLWTTLTASGRVRLQSRDEALSGARSIACSDDGTVVIAVPRVGKVYLCSRDHHRLRDFEVSGVGHILGVKGGSIVALSEKPGTMFTSLDVTSTAASTVPIDLGRAPASLARPSRKGQAAMDLRRDQLVYVKSGPEEISVFDRNGATLLSRTIQPEIPSDLQVAGGPQEAVRVWGILPLNDGYIVNIWQERFDPATRALASHLGYQILGRNLKVLGYASEEAIGTIVAADDSGGVYGVEAWGGRFSVAKARLALLPK